MPECHEELTYLSTDEKGVHAKLVEPGEVLL